MYTLGDIPRKHAKLHPDWECMVCGETRLNWKQLNERVNRLANGLTELGVSKDTKVAGLMLNCHKFIEMYYACAKLGAVSVPLNYRLSTEELIYIINHSDTEFLLVGEEFIPTAEEILPRIQQVRERICLDQPHRGWISYEELLERSSAAEPDVEVDEDDLAQLQYTGGTTGKAKGVMLTHRNLLTSTLGNLLAVPFEKGDTTLQVLPIFHTSWWPILTLHYVGCRAVIAKRFDFHEILSLVEKEKVTHINMVPVLFSWILAFPDLDKYDLSSLKLLTYAGAPMPVDLLKRCIEKFGNIFMQGYGLTEAAPLGTQLIKEDHVVEGPPELTRRLASAGRESLVTEVSVFDDSDNPVEVGKIGEIVIRGKNIMKGYWKDPELTEKTLRGGWLHTGDLATIDEDGYIYIVDRKNDMIITGGENVYPFEVERILYEHPAVLEAAVVGLPSEKWGEEVTAAVALKDGVEATEEELIAFCKERIAGYKCPKRVVFMESLPKTPIGKILRRQVREQLQSGKEAQG